MVEAKQVKEFALEEVQGHTSSSDCWLVIGNASNGGPKVYDVTKFLDHHPGGAEVILEVAGTVADEFFEDIGHSNDAREEMKKHLIGDFKMDAATLAKMEAAAESKAKAKEGGGSNMSLIFLVALIATYVAYTRMR